MIKLIFTVVGVLASFSTFAQGTILFNNRTLTAGDIRVYADPSRTTGAGSLGTVNAQLFLVNGSGATVAYTPLTPATTFRTGNASFFVNPVDVTTDLPAGTTVNLVMRIWMGLSYEQALLTGFRAQSDTFSLRLGGANPVTGEIIQTPDLAGNLGNPMQPFHISIPEPSTIALGVLGALVLLYRRRK